MAIQRVVQHTCGVQWSISVEGRLLTGSRLAGLGTDYTTRAADGPEIEGGLVKEVSMMLKEIP